MMNEETHLDGEVNDFNAVYSDVITFVAALFILLFSLSYTEDSGKSLFEDIQLQMLKKKDSQQLEKKQVEVDDLLDQRLSQFVTTEFTQQRIKVSLNDPILFDTNQSMLKQKNKVVIDQFVDLIEEMPNKVIIQGEASDKEVDIAEDIAFQRAKSVYDYMIDIGVSKKRLVIQTSGLSKHINKPPLLQQNVNFYLVRAVSK